MRRYENFLAPCIWANSEFLEASLIGASSLYTLKVPLLARFRVSTSLGIPMPSTSPSEILADPLSDITRKERRNLLLASTVGAIVATMGLVPTRFSALGIDFSPPAQSSFVILVTLVILYFVLAFLFYGVADFFVWLIKYKDYLVAINIESSTWDQESQYRYDEVHSGIPYVRWLNSLVEDCSFLQGYIRVRDSSSCRYSFCMSSCSKNRERSGT